MRLSIIARCCTNCAIPTLQLGIGLAFAILGGSRRKGHELRTTTSQPRMKADGTRGLWTGRGRRDFFCVGPILWPVAVLRRDEAQKLRFDRLFCSVFVWVFREARPIDKEAENSNSHHQDVRTPRMDRHRIGRIEPACKFGPGGDYLSVSRRPVVGASDPAAGVARGDRGRAGGHAMHRGVRGAARREPSYRQGQGDHAGCGRETQTSSTV